MSTIFPGSASVNQIFQGYRYNGEKWELIGIDLTADYLEESVASSLYLTQSSASITYITQASASTTYATKSELNNIDLSSASAAAVAAIVDSAPSTLNTLNELAAALNDDASFAGTVTTALSNKLNTSTASSTYATILDPVFTNNVQIEGDLKFDVVDGTEKGLIRVLSGPGYNQLQVYTPEQLNLYSEGYAGIYSDDNVIIGGTNGEFLNSSGSANQIATIGNINSLSDIYEKIIPYSSSAPSSPVTGDLWVDSSTTPPALKTYNGSAWVQLGSAVDDPQAIIASSMFMG